MNKSIGECMHKKASTEIEISKNSTHQQHFEHVSTHFLNYKQIAEEKKAVKRKKKQNLRNMVMMSHMSSTFYCDTTNESSPRGAQRSAV